VLVRLGEQVRRAHVDEEARVEGEQLAETKLCADRPRRAERADLCVPTGLGVLVTVVEHEHPVGEEEGDEPDAGHVPTRWLSPDASKASGSTSNSATATTMPLDRAMSVCM
jgi:hypothetical protein